MIEQDRSATHDGRTWNPGDLLDATVYLWAAVGYLMAILAASHLTLVGFIVVTVGTVGWVALFRWLTSQEPSAQAMPYAALGLAAMAFVAALGCYFGTYLDWLLPVVTVAIFAVIYPPRLAVLFGGAMWLITAVLLFVVDQPFGVGNFLRDQATLLPAFIFAFAFTALWRREQELRERAEVLVRELEETQAQLQAYAGEVEELAVTRERNRLAREIHDTLGHYLTILAVQLETALKLEERGDAQLHKELVEARRMASECLTEVRRSVAALRPADPTAHSFAEALSQLAAECEAAQPDTDVVLDIEGPVQALPTELRVALYRCVQEALTNVRKHARATKVLVRVRVSERRAELTVLDNGIGEAANADGHAAGFGLLGMRERIALLNGTVTAQAEPSQGWRVEVSLPVPSRSGDDPAQSDVHLTPPALAQIEG